MRMTGFFIVAMLTLTFISMIPSAVSQQNLVVLSNIELVTLESDSASITWVTNLPEDTRIQWGETEELGNELIVPESTNYHIAWMEDLEEGTTYFYRVGSGGRWSEISSLTTQTPPNSAFKLKFALVTDMHYDVDGRVTPSGMMYADSVRIVGNLVDELNRDTDIEFVMTMGDLTNGAETDFYGFVAEMERLNVQWYPVLGNHDKTFADWYSYYLNSTGYTDTYYMVKHAGYNLIILDSAVQGQVSGDLDDDQLNWLEVQLDSHAWEPTIIFMHHLIDRTDVNGIDADAQSKIHEIIKNRPYVLSVNSGHIHQNIVTQGDDLLYISTAATVSYPIGYSKVKLFETGYTSAFYKIEAELAASEESRMGVITFSGDPDGDQECLGELDDRSFVVQIPEKPTNTPPSISSVSITPDVIYTEETAIVDVIATDPEGDPLDYFYSAGDGTIEGSGSRVTYQAPVYPGTYRITAYVNDGELSSAERSVDIEVIERGEPKLNHAPWIEKVTSNLMEVEPEGTVRISVRASDEDGDVLIYHFDVSGGTVLGEGNRVDWRAPAEPGEYTIKAWVSDGQLESDQLSLTLTVYEPGPLETKSEDDMPGFDIALTIISILVVLIGYRLKLK